MKDGDKSREQLLQEIEELCRRVAQLEEETKALSVIREELKESEERYRSLVENTLEGYFVCEIPSGVPLFLNKTFRDLLGYSPEEGLTHTLWDVILPDEHERIREQSLSHQKQLDLPATPQIYKAKRKDGSVFSAEITTSQVLFHGKTAIQGIVRDVTEREQLEQQLQYAQKMKALGSLSGGVAHEFNNILTAIQGNSELLIAQLGADHPLSRYAREINGGCQRAANLTRRMLTFARMDTISKVPVKVNQLIRTVSQFLKQALPPAIELELDLQSGLPFVMAEPSQLEQVFLNIALNSRDAMPKGGKIRFSTCYSSLGKSFSKIYPWARPGSYMEVVVEDTGEGMPPEVMERIFEPLFTTRKPGGSKGLGLSIAFSIVKNHGGHILAESEVGVGSRFRIYLPLLEEKLDFDESDNEEFPANYGLERILVVDDEARVREVTKAMLLGAGYRVSTAAHGQEALMMYQQASAAGDAYDLVILDLIMPVMDGKTCLLRLREINPRVRVLIITGYYDEQAEACNPELKVNGVLAKPYDVQTLLQSVRNCPGAPGNTV